MKGWMDRWNLKTDLISGSYIHEISTNALNY